MPARYFTADEINTLLPELEPLMGQLLERRAKVVASRYQVMEILHDFHSNVGGAGPSEMVGDFMVIERLIHRIRAYGCVVKDLNVGLLDFLAERDGREVYLCWRYGEPRVEYFHELHTGFMSRQRI